MDAKKYFERLSTKIVNMPDDEFMQLLIESGLEECPLKDSFKESEAHLLYSPVQRKVHKKYSKKFSVTFVNEFCENEEFIYRYNDEKDQKLFLLSEVA